MFLRIGMMKILRKALMTIDTMMNKICAEISNQKKRQRFCEKDSQRPLPCFM